MSGHQIPLLHLGGAGRLLLDTRGHVRLRELAVWVRTPTLLLGELNTQHRGAVRMTVILHKRHSAIHREGPAKLK